MTRDQAIEEGKTFTYENLKDEKKAKRFIDIYKFLYNVTNCSRCMSRVKNYYAQFKYDFIISPTIKNQIMSTEKKFVLREGAVIRLPKTVTDYTNANLTDEIAESILRQVPGFAKFFEKIPADFAPKPKSLIDETAPPALSDLKRDISEKTDIQETVDNVSSNEELTRKINESDSPTLIKALAEKGNRHVRRAATMRLRALGYDHEGKPIVKK